MGRKKSRFQYNTEPFWSSFKSDLMFSRVLWMSLLLSCSVHAAIEDLKQAYPEFIKAISKETIIWSDGTKMKIRRKSVSKALQDKVERPSLWDQVSGAAYLKGTPKDPVHYRPQTDPGRVRYEPFFKKMYGATPEAVEEHLVTIYWMPVAFGHQYPLRVTTVNRVDEKLRAVSKALDALVKKHPHHLRFLRAPGGTFEWRKIAHTHRQSLHSFGIAIDINDAMSNYWQSDLAKEVRPISEHASIGYRNRLPWQIVRIFEEHGFIWGGKWHHYDTEHFEYRPELLLESRYG